MASIIDLISRPCPISTEISAIYGAGYYRDESHTVSGGDGTEITLDESRYLITRLRIRYARAQTDPTLRDRLQAELSPYAGLPYLRLYNILARDALSSSVLTDRLTSMLVRIHDSERERPAPDSSISIPIVYVRADHLDSVKYSPHMLHYLVSAIHRYVATYREYPPIPVFTARSPDMSKKTSDDLDTLVSEIVEMLTFLAHVEDYHVAILRAIESMRTYFAQA